MKTWPHGLPLRPSEYSASSLPLCSLPRLNSDVIEGNLKVANESSCISIPWNPMSSTGSKAVGGMNLVHHSGSRAKP